MDNSIKNSLITKKEKDISKNKELLNINEVKNKKETTIKQFDYYNVLRIPLILNQIFQFMNKYDIKNFCLCNKHIYQIYSDQNKKLKINRINDKLDFLKLLDKYQNIIKLDLSKVYELDNISFLEKTKNLLELNLYYCEKIKDFSPIAFCEKLEYLNVNQTNISDISFLEKNKNIKELKFNYCKKIKDFSPSFL